MILLRRSVAILLYVGCLAFEARLASAQPALPKVIKAEPPAEWNALFTGGEGWIGGDGVYSTTLNRERVLFLFGDTLIGKVKNGRRAGAAMVNNTIGVMDRNSVPAPVQFAFSKSDNDEPAAMFRPADGHGWFWPQAAVEIDGRLFVFLAQIEKTSDEGVFGFRQVGQWLATIERPLEDPQNWHAEQRPIPFVEFKKGRERVWGSALFVGDDYVYIYGIEDRERKLGSKQLIVARAPLAKLAEFDRWEFRGDDGWSTTAAAESLAAGLANEFSVSRLADGNYVLIYTESGLSDRILARVAASPDGPWSAPRLVYTCPETAADKGLFCYSAKEHPWASQGNTLLISYCVNAWKFGRLFEDEAVYRPKFVKVTFGAASQR
ncbi:MAG TPA: DUF4185 domain-containing protein [Pirellulales bacterium]|nr:DUF4185 domain-containing protein [Pirellulales bacterium]